MNKFNPVTKYEFDSFKEYQVISFDKLKEDYKNLNNYDEVILVETDETFTKIVQFLTNIDNTQINFIDPNRECILFKDHIIFRVKDYQLRKSVCEKLNMEYELLNYQSENSSWAKIGNDIYQVNCGDIPKSSYNNYVKNFVDNYAIEPLHFGRDVIGKWKYKIGADCPKSYSNGVLKYFKDNKIGVLSIFDNFVEDQCILTEVNDDRYYLIESIDYHGLKTSTSISPYFVVENLINRGVIVKSYGYIKYTKYIDGNNFCWMIKNSYTFLKEFNDTTISVSKNIVNSFIGSLNRKYKSDNIGFITRDVDMAIYALSENFDAKWDGEGDDIVYVCGSHNKVRLNSDNCLIYSSCIWAGILNLFDMVDFIDKKYKKYEITGCNTDAVYFESDHLYESKNNGRFDDKTYKIGLSEYRYKNFVKFDDNVFEYSVGEWKFNKDGNYLINFMGGSGKTELGVRENNDKRILGLAYENSAVDNLRDVCGKNGVVDFECMTIHRSLALDINGNSLINTTPPNFNDYDTIIIDELFRMDPWLLSKLYFKLIEFNGKIILIGHSSQIKYISNENFDYSKCDCIGDLVGWNYYYFNDEEMDYKIDNGFCRYDREMYDMLKHFEKYRNLNGFKFNKIDLSLKTNLSGSNKFNDKINHRFSKKMKVGDKFILMEHYEEKGYYKGYMGIVNKLEDDLVNGMFRVCDVKLNYATTIHKYQGKKITEKYNIFITKYMSFEVLYTALSRATKMSDIHLDDKLINRTFKSEYSCNGFNEFISKIENGYIYCIYCDITGTYYIGMTKGDIYKRFDEHIGDPNSAIKEMKNPVIKLIGEVKGNDKLIRKFEKKYTIHYKNLYGDNCLNRTNFKENKIDITGWNYVEKVSKTIISDCDGFFMVKYKILDVWKRKKFCYKKIGKEGGMEKVNLFIESLN